MCCASDFVQVARFFDGNDTRRMCLERSADGTVCVVQKVDGPGVKEAYGSSERLIRVRFDGEEFARLEGLLDAENPAGAVERFISREDNDVLDLVDLCDKQQVRYTYVSGGPYKVAAVRGAAE